ncbi:MAG TPA: 4Fe-4S binding protein [Candidatus Hydrothermia bacterium]|nr:4Fe-4S binding protein [Candidatus Hydrothermia bacterium]
MHRNRIAERTKKVSVSRRVIQILSTLGINSYIPDFQKFSIYQGPIKGLCAPGLNCYACPFARTSCPIGSLQHFIVIRQFPRYVLGYIGAVGVLFGRAFCGWLCPFGFLQELLKKLSKFRVKVSKTWGNLKYLLLAIMIPAVFFTYEPLFCKLCPAGTIEGALPIMLSPLWSDLSSLISYRFVVKILIAVLFVVLFVVIRRPFCRFVCPLGAIWGFFNKMSVFRFSIQSEDCIKCDLCQEVCPMDIRIYEDPNHYDCIRCLKCVYACPKNLIRLEALGAPVIKPGSSKERPRVSPQL